MANVVSDDVIIGGGGWSLMTFDDEGGRGSKMAYKLMT